MRQSLLIAYRAKYPDHKFIGEESTAAADGKIDSFTNKPTWIIDPIDGTMNFVHSNPNVSISVGMTVNRKPVLGIVYLPAYDQMYSALKGAGATLNGRSIKVMRGGESCEDAGSNSILCTHVHCLFR